MGLIIGVVVIGANVQSRDGANLIFNRIRDGMGRMCKIMADSAYAGQLIDWVVEHCGWLRFLMAKKVKCGTFSNTLLGWKHINFLGKYDIDLEQTYPLDRLRALHYPPFYM